MIHGKKKFLITSEYCVVHTQKSGMNTFIMWVRMSGYFKLRKLLYEGSCLDMFQGYSNFHGMIHVQWDRMEIKSFSTFGSYIWI